MSIGAIFKWPVMTKEVTEQGLVTDKGELIPAQTVIISIGDVPSLPFLPESVNVMKIAGGVAYRYVSDDSKCVACGFCADTCPCGIWNMRPF